ncbi:MAG: hypothetical protein AAGC90_11300 [Curtobacterium sp.]|jgi:hypothetical protein|uniref:hypothetical protein n=1 Tax=Curtobacterium sp. Curtsp57 TaxID=3243047 RepID=UPI0031B50D89
MTISSTTPTPVTPVPAAASHFAESVVIDPSSADGVVVRGDLSGRAWRIGRDAAVAAVLGQVAELSDAVTAAEESVPDDTRATWRRWNERGWRWSAPSFLASRRVRFVDRQSDFREAQAAEIEQYAEVAPMPLEPVDTVTHTLPAADAEPDVSVGAMLRRRHSVPNPPARRVSAAELRGILGGALARVAAERARPESERRAKPLTSFATAFDFYVTCYAVDDVPDGTYRVTLPDLGLALVAGGDRRAAMARSMIGQSGPLRGAFTFTVVADFGRQQWRYRHERAMSLLWMDAARVASEVIWQATARSKEMQISPAVLDVPMLEGLGLPTDGSHQCLYNVTVS